MKKITLLGFLKTILLFLVSVNVFSQAPSQPQDLVVNPPLERELSAGQTHEYRIKLKAGEFMQVRVEQIIYPEQNGIDIILSIHSSDGTLLAEMDNLNGKDYWEPAFNVEEFSFIARKTDNYIIKINRVNLPNNPQSGKYSIWLRESRPSKPEDAQLIQSEQSVFQQAKRKITEIQRKEKANLNLPRLTIKTGHTDTVNGVAISADRRIIASTSSDKTIKLWDAASGQELLTITGHGYLVKSVAFSPDGKILASADLSFPNNVTLWDVASGRKLKSLKGEVTSMERVTFSPDGKTVFSWYPFFKSARAWAVDTGQELKFFPEDDKSSKLIGFSLDGRTVASSVYAPAVKPQLIKLWDVSSKQEIKAFNLSPKTEFLALSFNGKILATVIPQSTNSGTIQLWDVSTGQELKAFDTKNPYSKTVLFSPDNKLLLLCASLEIELWNIDSGQKIKIPKRLWVDSVEFSPDSKTFALDSYAGVRLFDSATGKNLFNLPKSKRGVESFVFSKDGNVIVSGGSDRTIKLWDARSGKKLKNFGIHTSETTVMGLSPDGKLLASGNQNNTVKVWDLTSGSGMKSFERENFFISSLVFSPNNQVLTVGSPNKFTVKLYDVLSGQELNTLKGYADDVNSVVISPDGKFFASGGRDKTIRLWEVATGQQLKVFAGHTSSINSVVFSADGKMLASGSSDKTAKVWDIAAGKELKTFKEQNNEILSVTLSPDGKTLAALDKENIIKLWDVNSGKVLESMASGYSLRLSAIKSIMFSPDGRMLFLNDDFKSYKQIGENKSWDKIAFSSDGKKFAAAAHLQLRFWSYETRQINENLRIRKTTLDRASLSKIMSITFSADGKFLAAGYEDGAIVLWNVDTGEDIRAFKTNGWRIEAIGFSPDGQKLVSIDRGCLRVWNVNTGKRLNLICTETNNIETIIFSPDGKTVTLKGINNTIRLIDIDSGKLLKSLPEDNPAVVSEVLARVPNFYQKTNREPITPDDRFQITRGENGSLNIYEMTSGKLAATLFSLDKNDWAVVDSDGRWDASEGAQKLMSYTLSTPEGYETIDFSQLKQRFHEPNLLRKIFSREPLTLTKESLGNFNNVPLYPKINLVESSNNTRGQPCLVENSLTPELDKQCRLFAFDLQARSGGIGKYVLRINDREVQEFPAPRTPQSSLKQELNLEDYKRYLIPDDKKTPEIEKNKIEIVAYNSEGWLPSRGKEVLYLYEEEKVEPPNLWVLAVGVSDYRGEENGLRDLTFADKDAEALASAVRVAGERLFPQRTTVKILTSNAKSETERANKTNIKRILTEFDKKAKSMDVVILYLSGHGVAYGSPPNDDFYFLTNEASRADLQDATLRKTTALSGEEIIKLLTKIPANKQVLILDTCASGKVIEQLTKTRDDVTKNYRAWDRMKDRAGLWLLAGSTSDAVSYESSRYGQGVLTYSLLRGMKEDSERALRKDDEGKSELVDVSTLFEYSRDEVPKLAKGVGGIQRPVIFNRFIENQKKEKTGSFDIGRITSSERAQIKLSQEKPAFVRSRFVIKDNQFGEDDLELTKQMNQFLQLELSKGLDARVAFFQTDEKFPNAYVIKSNYERKGNEITVNVKVTQYISNGNRNFDGSEQTFEKDVGGLLQVTGKTEDIQALMEEIIKGTIEIINKR